MKKIIKIATIVILVFVFCYIGASFHSGSFDLEKMTKETREGVIMTWMFISFWSVAFSILHKDDE